MGGGEELARARALNLNYCRQLEGSKTIKGAEIMIHNHILDRH